LAAGGNGRSSSGGSRGTLRPAADATWRPEMNYRRFRCCSSYYTYGLSIAKGAITSKMKLAIKHKTSPARLAQLLHSPHLHFVLACSQ